MEIVPIASDSLGVRSMATFVKTGDVTIAVDPEAALGPIRYGLPPHQKELDALLHYKKLAHKEAARSDIIVLSHYHFDHFDTGGDWFRDKVLYVKSIKGNINRSQTERGADFEKAVGGIAKPIDADGKEFKHGKTKIKFSPPVPHGPPGIRLGFVLMTLIDDGKKSFIHASDVQGPVAAESADWIIEQKPDLVYMDGPPVLFLGWKFSYKNLEDSKANFQRILDETKTDVILDHHLLRSLNYKEMFPFFGERVKTAAEFLGKENKMLEARRKELWGK